jgi:hypothetical protein
VARNTDGIFPDSFVMGFQLKAECSILLLLCLLFCLCTRFWLTVQYSVKILCRLKRLVFVTMVHSLLCVQCMQYKFKYTESLFVGRSSLVRPDSGVSGMGSPHKSSVFSSPYYGGSESVLDDSSRSTGKKKMSAHRPGDQVCVTSEDKDDLQRSSSSVIYAYPKVNYFIHLSAL